MGTDPIRPARVALRVSDVERSARFYEVAAGLRIAALDLDAAVLCDPAPDGAARLELRRAACRGRAARRATGLFHTAFLFADRARLGARLHALAAARVDLTGASDHLVSEALYLDDPDGLGVELYRDRPRDEWPAPGPGERVHMDTVALDLGPLLDADHAGLAADGVGVGHVHLKVADVEAAVGFWTSDALGLELMTRFGHQAAFLASGGYHHHIGANTWLSAGAGPEDPDGPGLDAVVLQATDSARAGEHVTPDGVRVVVEAAP